jgi:hypothetical protein
VGIERSSDKHGPLRDDELKKEVEGMVRSGRPTRAEEWHDPEPIEDENSLSEDELIERRRAEEAGRTRRGGADATDDVGPPAEGEDATDTTDTVDPEPAEGDRAW